MHCGPRRATIRRGGFRRPPHELVGPDRRPVGGRRVIFYVAGIGAARILGAKLSWFVGLTEVMFAVLVAWLVLGELPSAVQLLGGALIVAGVALVRVDELRPPRRQVPKVRTPEPSLVGGKR